MNPLINKSKILFLYGTKKKMNYWGNKVLLPRSILLCKILYIYIKSSLLCYKRVTKGCAAKILSLVLMILPGISNCIISYLPNSLRLIYTCSSKPSTIMLNSICIISLEVSITIFNSLSWFKCFHHWKALPDHAKLQCCLLCPLAHTHIPSNIHRISFQFSSHDYM